SNVVTNDLFQPWRALLTIINLCLTRKTSEFERPRAPVLQILWGIVTRTNIDYAERIWEEFTQSIHTFIEDKRNLSRHTTWKKRATLIVIPSIRFTKLIIHHLQRKHRFHPRPDSPLHLSNEEPVLGYLKFSAKGGVQNPPAPKPTQPARKPKAPTRPSISIPVASTQPAPTSAPAKSQENKRKQATETTDKPAKAKMIKHSISRKKRSPKVLQSLWALEESMKDAYALPKGPLPLVVIREPESGKYQPLPEVPGKGKAKVTEEQVAHDLLSLQKHKKTSPVDQHDESPYALLGQSDNEEESEKVVLKAEEGSQDKGQAGPDPDAQAKDQTGSDAEVGQTWGRLYTLEQLDIPQQVSITVSEVVMDAVDWAMQAPLRNHFRDLPEADMKEILHQRMWESDSYKSHEDHMQLFEALEKSTNRDHSEELAQDLAEARKKKKKSRESPKTPPGSPSHQPPPPPPPAEERPTTPEPAWSIRSSDVPVPTNNLASALAANYSPPPEDSLLEQTGDIAT
nr:hypothetical protein [Tanacetum cinerariifolium]